ncbi:MAG: histidine ammonia-lyase [Firmicutes bacterium]|nr:histidine ammonia-lyase [Bacillota bacterium]
MSILLIDGMTLTYKDVVGVARHKKRAGIAPGVRERVVESRATIESVLQQDTVIYGVNTGFGHLAKVRISRSELGRLQENLIMSHASGTGSMLPDEVVRAMTLLRANSLAKGLSGVRYELIEALVDLVNHDICPLIPEQGSLGASGDLAPLAHLALALLGKGKVRMGSTLMDADEALRQAGISRTMLAPKEGLGLINGTQGMTAIGAIALYDAMLLAVTADAVACLSIQALRGIPDSFRPCVHQARPHPGQIECAEFISKLLDGSGLTSAPGEFRVQDAYSLRCIPQVHGAVRDVLGYIKDLLDREINSASDNPLVFPDGNIISAGNFHGQPIAFAMDFLSIALSELGSISERRIERLLNPVLSEMPAFLTSDSGINSGFMIPHYTAASLVSENKVLCTPASIDSIPVSAAQEDHVSMGMIAARKARKIVNNVACILAIELMCACQAVEFRNPEKLTPQTRGIYDLVRGVVPPLSDDRRLYPDIHRITELIKEGEVAKLVEPGII